MATGSVRAVLGSATPTFSFEFFPPKTDAGERQLWQALRELEPLRPSFVSVTYGAGGSTQDRTVRITERIASDTTMVPVGHLTCVGASRAQLRQVIGSYAAAGVSNILALRGDPPSGVGAPWTPHPDGLRWSTELVALLRELGSFCVGVAAFPEGHPAAPDLASDAAVLKRKEDAGAEFAVSQFFFDPSAYTALVDRARAAGVTIPIVAGVMPVTNVGQIRRFAELSGAAFPPALATRLQRVQDDPEAVRAIGVAVATELCRAVLDAGAPGIHFYTLNRSTATREVYANLGLAAAARPA